MSDRQRLLELICSDRTPDERLVCGAAFHAILRGEALDRDGLARSTGFAPEKVDALLEGLKGRGLIVVEPGGERIVGSWGLSLVPTNHRLSIRGRDLHTWCAVDVVGIPAALREDAIATSRCHECGVPVRIEMAAGEIRSVEPADVRIWVAPSQAGRSVVGST
jgi:alkylmercury lyase